MVVIECEQGVEDLQESAAVLAGRLNRAHADLVDLTSRLLEGDRWAGGGVRSAEHWLVVRVGLSPPRAREVVRIARRRQEIPATVDRLAAGRLSVDQAAVVARLAPATHQQSIAELVEHLSVPSGAAGPERVRLRRRQPRARP